MNQRHCFESAWRVLDSLVKTKAVMMQSAALRLVLDALVLLLIVVLKDAALVLVVDVLVLVSHLGLDEDEGLASDRDALDGVGVESIPLEGVDIILGGHLHIVLNPPKVVSHANGGRTVLVHSGAFAKYVGRLARLGAVLRTRPLNSIQRLHDRLAQRSRIVEDCAARP